MTTIQPAPEGKIAKLETALKIDESAIVTWLKNKWEHLPTWAMALAAVLRLFGKL